MEKKEKLSTPWRMFYCRITNPNNRRVRLIMTIKRTFNKKSPTSNWSSNVANGRFGNGTYECACHNEAIMVNSPESIR